MSTMVVHWVWSARSVVVVVVVVVVVTLAFHSRHCAWYGVAPSWRCDGVLVELYTEFVVTASGMALLQVGGVNVEKSTGCEVLSFLVVYIDSNKSVCVHSWCWALGVKCSVVVVYIDSNESVCVHSWCWALGVRCSVLVVYIDSNESVCAHSLYWGALECLVVTGGIRHWLWSAQTCHLGYAECSLLKICSRSLFG